MRRSSGCLLTAAALAITTLAGACTATGSPHPAGNRAAAGCPARDLSVSTIRTGSTAADTVEWFVIVNRSARACAVSGHPRIDATVPAIGPPLRIRTLASGFGVPPLAAHRVELASSGGTVSFLVGAALAAPKGGGPCQVAKRFTFALTGIAGRVAAHTSLPDCRPAVSVSPVFAGRTPPGHVPALGLGFVPVSAAFWTARMGLVAGYVTTGACRGRCPGEVELTTDGGSAWRVALRTPWPVVAVATTGADTAFVQTATPGRLYRTADGGREWAVVGRGVNARLMAFGTPVVGWTGGGLAAPAPFATSDGGRTWRRLALPCGDQPNAAVTVTATSG